CGARSTKPMSAKEAITRVIEGGRTRSRIARAPGVIAPSLANVANADSWESDTGDDGFRNRSCRASRMTANDRSLASRASLSGTARHYNGTRARGIQTTDFDILSALSQFQLNWPTARKAVRAPPRGAQRRQAMLSAMSADPDQTPQPPPLPPALLAVWPVPVI